ncbi:MAG: hypothetical protein QXZ40_01760, partial [Candidatus Micrarchaeia archaeon]
MICFCWFINATALGLRGKLILPKRHNLSMAQKLAEAKKSDEECKRERRESFIDYGSVSRYWGRAAQQDAFIIKVKPNASVVIITPLLKENNVKNIIDFGCGAGSDAIFLAK